MGFFLDGQFANERFTGETDTQFDCVVCVRCLDQLESAGQLVASALCGSRVEVPANCEQCDLPLVDGETYRARIEP